MAVTGTGRGTATATRTEKGISLARGPALILGTILLAAGLYFLYKEHFFPPFSHFPNGKAPVEGKVFGIFGANGWTGMLTAVAGGLLLFGAAQHLLAKTMSLIVGVALAAAAIIGAIKGNVLGMAAANAWTEIAWGIAAAILLFNVLIPRRRTTVPIDDRRRGIGSGPARTAEPAAAGAAAPVATPGSRRARDADADADAAAETRSGAGEPAVAPGEGAVGARREESVAARDEEPLADRRRVSPVAAPREDAFAGRAVAPARDVRRDEQVADVRRDEPVADAGRDEPVADAGRVEPVADAGRDQPVADASREEPLAGTRLRAPGGAAAAPADAPVGPEGRTGASDEPVVNREGQYAEPGAATLRGRAPSYPGEGDAAADPQAEVPTRPAQGVQGRGAEPAGGGEPPRQTFFARIREWFSGPGSA
ncbi:MAG: hypothetical protein JOY58_06180 [Solirubrobacterales bacterium]|nr:hypothetical protein [Solirubrobacterales bacterium]